MRRERKREKEDTSRDISISGWRQDRILFDECNANDYSRWEEESSVPTSFAYMKHLSLVLYCLSIVDVVVLFFLWSNCFACYLVHCFYSTSDASPPLSISNTFISHWQAEQKIWHSSSLFGGGDVPLSSYFWRHSWDSSMLSRSERDWQEKFNIALVSLSYQNNYLSNRNRERVIGMEITDKVLRLGLLQRGRQWQEAISSNDRMIFLQGSLVFSVEQMCLSTDHRPKQK